MQACSSSGICRTEPNPIRWLNAERADAGGGWANADHISGEKVEDDELAASASFGGKRVRVESGIEVNFATVETRRRGAWLICVTCLRKGIGKTKNELRRVVDSCLSARSQTTRAEKYTRNRHTTPMHATITGLYKKGQCLKIMKYYVRRLQNRRTTGKGPQVPSYHPTLTTISPTNHPNHPIFHLQYARSLIPIIPDPLFAVLAVPAYWPTSGFLHFFDVLNWSWLDRYRIHNSAKVAFRNRAMH